MDVDPRLNVSDTDSPSSRTVRIFRIYERTQSSRNWQSLRSNRLHSDRMWYFKDLTGLRPFIPTFNTGLALRSQLARFVSIIFLIPFLFRLIRFEPNFFFTGDDLPSLIIYQQ